LEDKNLIRLDIQGGMSTANSADLLPPGKFAFLQNVRRILQGRTVARPALGSNVLTGALPSGPTSMLRLNDATPIGPASRYAMVIGAAGKMYVNTAQVATGMTGNPLGMVTFRPNTSPEPFAYIADNSPSGVTLNTTALVTGGAVNFPSNGMIKVNANGLAWKTGIAEPQEAPQVTLNGATLRGSFTLNANAAPWTNYGGVNTTANFTETSYGSGGSDLGPGIIGNLVQGSSLSLTVTGTATVNTLSHAPGDPGPSTSTYPGAYVVGGSPLIVLGAFADANGNIVPTTAGGAIPAVYNVGAAATLPVPPNAVQFQVGVDSAANSFYLNSGTFTVGWTLTISAASPNTSIAGEVTAYVWGDSPHSGPVAQYIWKNAGDSGSGMARSTSDAQVVASNNSLIFDSTPSNGSSAVQWSVLNSSGTVTGSIVLFSPAFESEGYEDFNACIIFSIFFPSAGSYTIEFVNKDQIMVGVGGGITGAAATGIAGQTKSVVSGLPLMYVSTVNGEGGAMTGTINITVPSQGIYPMEIDWDYWYHSGRTLVVTASATPMAAPTVIPPLQTGNYHINAQYRGVYRSSATGAVSNPSPASLGQTIPLQANAIALPYTSDPQVDLCDYYRLDEGLDNYTYIATGPNDGAGATVNSVLYNTAIFDELTDTLVISNPTLEYDNFEPFPSIDSPAKGVVNVGNGGVITWVSGTQFNTRWLPGTVIQIGSPSAQAYVLYTRPTSATAMTIPGVNAGNNLAYSIAEPILAAQPSPTIWGPTPDNAGAFAFAVDPLNTGDLVWTKGNNFDSAPDTNRLNVTSPSETMMNGVVTSELSMVFSTDRFWLIYPNFADAVATATGTVGSPWILVQSGGTRGLYMRYAIGALGGTVAFRAKDCIAVTTGGGPEQPITDDIYNLFPHGGTTPQPVQIGPYTVYPPDDTKPNAQTIAVTPGYIFYNYQDVNGNPRTLVYDIEGKGWSVDSYTPTVNCHLYAVGTADMHYAGCTDGTVRPFISNGAEVGTSIIVTRSENGGSARVQKIIGGWFLRAVASTAITLAYYAQRFQTAITGFTPLTVTGASGIEQDFLIDFTNAANTQVLDAGMIMSWGLGSGNILSAYGIDWTEVPEQIIGFKTGQLSYGRKGWMTAPWIQLAYQSTATVNLTMTLIGNQGDVLSSIPLAFPSTGGVQAKQFITLPPNKFKLVGWTANSAAPFSVFAQDSELMLVEWGGNAENVRPFEGFGIKGATV
jgi:hypothetical protein